MNTKDRKKMKNHFESVTGSSIENMTLTDKTFNKFLSVEVKNHEKSFKTNDNDGFMPQLTVYMKGDKDEAFTVALMVIAGDTFDTYEDRCKTFYEIGKKVHTEFTKKQHLSPIVIFMSSEAWMKTMKPGEKQDKEYVHDYPDKKEVIITYGLTIDQRSNMASQDITRNKKRNISLGKPQVINYDPKGKNPESPMLINFYKGWFIASQGTGVLN